MEAIQHKDKKKVIALIPCFNEEEGIAAVLEGFPREQLAAHGFVLDVIVIDNNSTDNTAAVARAGGATVIHEQKKGKGNAMRRGFYAIPDDAAYVVMLDGDNTYRPQEMLRLLELLDSGFCSVAIGSRLAGRISAGSMPFTNRLGNWIFSHLVRAVYRVNVTDVLTGYFAWTREAIERLRPHLQSEGFAIEMEMVTKMARLGESMYCVPISYLAREGESHLRPFSDGARILRMCLKNVAWRPPTPKPQRIAFVTDSVMPYFIGGKERRLYELTRRLALRGKDVHVYTMRWWDGPRVMVQEGVTYHALCRQYPLYVGERRSIVEALLFALATFRLLFERFDVLDVDHIPLFPLCSARVVAWLRGKTLYATWHEVWGRDYWLEYLPGIAGHIGYRVEQLSLLLPDVIISVSSHTTARLAAAGVTQTVHTIPLGADLADIYTAEPHDMTSDVVFVGRLLKHKNALMLVEAIALVRRTYPAIRMVIIGDGPERPAIEQSIRTHTLGDNVRLFDRVERSTELYSVMKSSKMLALPSVREGFGLVVIEAHAAGIPVLTTAHKNNAAKDLINVGVNGFLVEPTAEDLAEKILRTLAVGKTMDTQQHVSPYDWQAVVSRFEQVLSA